MTLEESKKEKTMSINGTIGRVDLSGLWFKVCIFERVKLSHANGKTFISFTGTVDEGLYVLGEVVKACQATKCHCHLEINHFFE